MVLLGLDSCATAQRRFYRHNGAIGEQQREYVQRIGRSPEWRAARHRIVLLHHHVVPLPAASVAARASRSACGSTTPSPSRSCSTGIRVNLAHRHLSEQRQPAGSDFTILASPSFTLGCRSGTTRRIGASSSTGAATSSARACLSSALATDDDPAENC